MVSPVRHLGQTQKCIAGWSSGKEFTGEIVLRPHLSLSKKCGLVLCHLPVPWRKRALARRADLGRQHRATYPRCADCSQMFEQHPVLTQQQSSLPGRAEFFSIILKALFPY